MQFVTANPRSNKLRRVPHGRVVTDGKIKNVSPHTHTHTLMRFESMKDTFSRS